ncbi:MAG: hypothetical protein MPN21_14355 [Thermoanaerobaculia bacterium]|nr:hypothetical protein [Thermoanaerobaculia bacterium]
MKQVILCLLSFSALQVEASDVLDMDKAVRDGDLKAVSSLIDKGVSPNIVLDEGKNAIWEHSPLTLAAWLENAELAELLVERGADVNYVNAASNTALKQAATTDQEILAGLLIEAGADVDFVDENEVPILFWAVSRESKKVIPLLIEAGADPDEEFDSMFHGKHSVRSYFSQEGKSDPSVLRLLDARPSQE